MLENLQFHINVIDKVLFLVFFTDPRIEMDVLQKEKRLYFYSCIENKVILNDASAF